MQSTAQVCSRHLGISRLLHSKSIMRCGHHYPDFTDVDTEAQGYNVGCKSSNTESMNPDWPTPCLKVMVSSPVLITSSLHSLPDVPHRAGPETLGSVATAWVIRKKCSTLGLESSLRNPSLLLSRGITYMKSCPPYTFWTDHHVPCPFSKQSFLKHLLHVRHISGGWETRRK